MIEKLKDSAFDIREGVVTSNDLAAFDEVFLTNAMGIRWVGQFRKKKYGNTRVREIHERFMQPVFS
jgi:branched-subunit amino acid aminotransferase/4-amino-4-deoxychorismate lyase